METPHLTLCFIAYRERATIERFLDAWLPYCDEISFVSALGSAEDDGTAQFIRDYCTAKTVLYTEGTYQNSPRYNWPHVDDFAAARQMSFDNAASLIPGQWLFWADIDDLPDGDPAHLRALAANGQADIWRFPYDVPDAGKMIMRERLVRADVWARCKWIGAIHEVIAKEPAVRMKDSHCVHWVHRPTSAKEKDPKRNLRILNSRLDDAPTNIFYVAQEYMAANNIPLMQRYARLFLEMPGGDRAMQYQARLWLCKAAETKAESSEHALAAYWLYPYAEALAALVKCAMQEDDAKKAAHFCDLLMACPVPAEPLWCHEPRWYGWARTDLFRRVTRLNGGEVFDPERMAFIRASDPGAAVQLREIWMAHASKANLPDIGFVCENDHCRHWLRQFRLWPEAPEGIREITVTDKPEHEWDLKP
jgi:hypothetical protein